MNRAVKLLIEYGADVNDHSSPEKDKELALIRFLLDANVDLTTSFWLQDGAEDDTILHYVVRNKYIKLVKLLLEYCPNLSICNGDQDTVLDIAKKHKSFHIIEIIEKELRHQIYKYLICRWSKNTKVSKETK